MSDEELTDSEINEALQSLYGWESYQHICCGGSTTAWRCKRPSGFSLPPSYCTDLNACHEVEKGLTPEQQTRYGDELWEALWDNRNYDAPYFFLIHASARHRALALLKTLSS